MTTIPRPNKEALIKVIDIYRDAMRPFLIHHLRQAPGKRVEDAIKQALRETNSTSSSRTSETAGRSRRASTSTTSQNWSGFTGETCFPTGSLATA